MNNHTSRLSPEDLDAAHSDLADVLHAAVNGGAAVSFVWPFSLTDSRAFWSDTVFPAVRSSACLLFAAHVDNRIVGTVQLHIDLPPNQPHRAEVSKLLVHPDFRRRGLARYLMQTLEDEAITKDRHLLTLDTRSDSDATPLYRSLGYQVTGNVPQFAINPDGTGFHATTYMYKII